MVEALVNSGTLSLGGGGERRRALPVGACNTIEPKKEWSKARTDGAAVGLRSHEQSRRASPFGEHKVMSSDERLLLPPNQPNEIDPRYIGSHYGDGPEHDVTLLPNHV